jgi:CheY-like chemotaxis protein
MKILLVSASEVFLKRNTNLLIRRGLQLFNTTSGEETLYLHKELNFDLIISDFKLDDMGGFELCSLIRKRENSQQVSIILTCQDVKGHLGPAEQCGASAIILKPIDPIQLLKTVGSFLNMPIVRSHRVELRVKVFCKDKNLEFFCLSHDVSDTGILIQTEHELELESRIICQFTLPPSYPVEAGGEVIRSMREMDGSHLYGVRFIDIQMSPQRAILDYVHSIITSVHNFS